MKKLAIGMRFVVKEPALFTLGGSIIANYRPESGEYQVTELNVNFISNLVASGKAAVTGWSPRRRKSGSIRVLAGGAAS